MYIAKALTELSPNAQWRVINNEIGGIVWESDDITQPSDSAIEAKVAELKAAEPMRLLRIERNKRLAETDWWANSDLTMTADQTAYRKALRDLPASSSPILSNADRTGIGNVTWPTKP